MIADVRGAGNGRSSSILNISAKSLGDSQVLLLARSSSCPERDRGRSLASRARTDRKRLRRGHRECEGIHERTAPSGAGSRVRRFRMDRLVITIQTPPVRFPQDCTRDSFVTVCSHITACWLSDRHDRARNGKRDGLFFVFFFFAEIRRGTIMWPTSCARGRRLRAGYQFGGARPVRTVRAT